MQISSTWSFGDVVTNDVDFDMRYDNPVDVFDKIVARNDDLPNVDGRYFVGFGEGDLPPYDDDEARRFLRYLRAVTVARRGRGGVDAPLLNSLQRCRRIPHPLRDARRKTKAGLLEDCISGSLKMFGEMIHCNVVSLVYMYMCADSSGSSDDETDVNTDVN